MSRKKKKSVELGPPGVPAYIVTFSDMVTLLLTFFVLLLSMAGNQNASLFKEAQQSFKSEVESFGMAGFMVSSKNGPEFGSPKVKHRMSEGEDKPDERSLDSQTEILRRIILKLEETMTITPSQITCRNKDFNVTDIRFERGKWQLNSDAKEYLKKYSRSLQESFTGQHPPTLYVIGLAEKERTEKQKWILSAKRAQSVADFLEQILPERPKWRVYSWGAGSGGQWSNGTGPMSKKAEIMITVLTE